jgi:hypothetical protein
MYERMVTLLEEAQTIWSLASSWLVGLRKWFDDPNTNRISFESGTMTDGVSFSLAAPHAYAVRIANYDAARSSASRASASPNFHIGLAE